MRGSMDGASCRASVRALCAAALLVGAGVAAAASVDVKDAWVRATVPGQAVAAAYLQIRSPDDARLVGIGVGKQVAARAELHSMRMDQGVMRMRRLDALDLPAGQWVALEPNGNHVMLLDVVKPLKPGESVALSLRIARKGKTETLKVVAEVRPVAQ